MPGRAKIPKRNVRTTTAKATVQTQIEGRSALVNKRQAMSSARGATTRALNRNLQYMGGDLTRGANLKAGILGMAAKADVPAETYAKLQKMDEGYLDSMYQNNEFVFDVYFDYGSVEKGADGSNIYTAGKQNDVDFLVEQYERMFGKLRGWDVSLSCTMYTALIWKPITMVIPPGSCNGP